MAYCVHRPPSNGDDRIRVVAADDDGDDVAAAGADAKSDAVAALRYCTSGGHVDSFCS